MSDGQQDGWVLRGEERVFFDYCNQERLMVQRCDVCQKAVFPPRSVCPHCWAQSLSWIQSTGRGTIHTFSVEMRPPTGRDVLVPYVIAIVDLDEGVRILVNVDAQPDQIHIGMRVRVGFRLFAGRMVPVFMADES